MHSRMVRYCYDQNRIWFCFYSCVNIGTVWRLQYELSPRYKDDVYTLEFIYMFWFVIKKYMYEIRNVVILIRHRKSYKVLYSTHLTHTNRSITLIYYQDVFHTDLYQYMWLRLQKSIQMRKNDILSFLYFLKEQHTWNTFLKTFCF